MDNFRIWLENEPSLPSVQIVRSLMPRLVQAAQQVYDAWVQDEDDDLNGGGICQDVADALGDVLSAAGIECRVMDANGVGEQHVWVIAKFREGIYDIDISPSTYETGGGYTWYKIPDVVFDGSDIIVDRSPVTEKDFENS